MELNTRGRYAVMAMAELARRTSEADGAMRSLPLSVIGTDQQLSTDYLEQIFMRLRRAGLVISARGRDGGYRLARPAEAITVADVLSAVSEDTRFTRCEGEQATGCIEGERCLTHDLWAALSRNVDVFLRGISLADVVKGLPVEKRFPAAPSARI